jgi:PAS domain S-box-containing protein
VNVHPDKLGARGAEGQSGTPGSQRGENPHTIRDPYRTLFENAPDGILLVDEGGRVLEANREAARLFGYARDELEGMQVERLVPPEVRSEHHAHRESYARDPRPRPMGIGMELAGLRKDGSRVPVEISLSPLPTEGPLVVITVVRDLTERRRLRDFGTGAVRAAEEERRRIARELHDDTAQRLAALIIRLHVAEQRSGEEGTAAELAALREELYGAVEGIRRMARGLRPPELEDLGLAAALRAHVRERFTEGRVHVSLEGPGDGVPLDTDTALAVYRVAQEALSNAARHSGADHIALRTMDVGGELVLEVRDDGCGFDPRRLREPGSGLGLLGMRERAGAAGGRLEVDSAPSRGTLVRLTVPVPGSTRPPHRGEADRE